MICYFAERQFNIKQANKMKLDLILSKIDEKYRKDVIDSVSNTKNDNENELSDSPKNKTLINSNSIIIIIIIKIETLENDLRESQKQISALQQMYNQTIDEMAQQKKQYNKMYQKMVELTEANNNLRQRNTPVKKRVVINENQHLSPYQIKVETLHRKTQRTSTDRSKSVPTKKKTIHVTIPTQIPIEKENTRLIKSNNTLKKKKKNTKPILGRQACFGIKC